MQIKRYQTTIAVFVLALTSGIGQSFAAALPEVSTQSQSAVVKAVKKVGPAVVNIDTVSYPKQGGRGLANMFPDFFGQPMPSQGQGSGWIYDGQNGYVITNEHVVENADQITITLPNKQQYEGKVVGKDWLCDVAVVKINGKNLPSLKLSTGGVPEIGSWAIAIGNPFGLQNSVTVGVISAMGREVQTSDGRKIENAIQTDASINPGNSGGPLCDINGNVIGMNAAVRVDGQGLGFAITADTIRKVVPDLIKHGRVIRPWVGFAYVDFTPKLARRFGMDYIDGVVIQVYRGFAADEAGLQSGDIIVDAGGKPVKSSDDLKAVIKNLKIGDKLPLIVVRDGRKNKFALIVGEMPKDAVVQ